MLNLILAIIITKILIGGTLKSINTQELNDLFSKKSDFTLLDVRENEEIKIAKIQSSTHIPMGQIVDRIDEIETVEITTHESAIRIISKEGALNNPADRDHCIQYMTAIGLLKGDLVAEDYEDDVASDPRIDELRSKMVIKEDERYTKEYLEEDKRSIANAIVIHFKDGSSTEKVEVEYPIGHRRRREQGIPLLIEKFKANLSTQFSENRTKEILSLCEDQSTLENSSVIDFMNLMIAE